MPARGWVTAESGTSAVMTADKNHSNSDDADTAGAHEPKGGRPGPTDEGRSGGMATRENAPEIAEDSGD